MTAAPRLTTSMDALLDDLAEHGVGVLEGALTQQQAKDARERLFAAAALSEQRGLPTTDYLFDPDGNNMRVFMLFNLDPLFVDLAVDSRVMQVAQRALDRDVLISNFSANIMGPGSGSMALHADQGQVLPPWPDRPLAVNVGWLLDDFAEANGATRYVPGSHLAGHGPAYGTVHETVPIEAPAGSMLAMDGRLWHQSGVNTTSDVKRAALFGYYTRSFLRPQVNWNVMLDEDVVAGLPESFLDLLGYRKGYVDLLGTMRRTAPS